MSGGLDPAISAKLEALALASAGTQVEVMLLGVQGLPGLRGSDHAVLGICCPEQVWFQAEGGPTWRCPILLDGAKRMAGACTF